MRPKKPILQAFITAAVLLVLGYTSCGIDEYYYLPQIPAGNIERHFNQEAIVTIPSIPSEYYYARYYTIFYRIYISNYLVTDDLTNAPSHRALVSPVLANDFNFFNPLTNPVNTTAITSLNTFRNRGFFELDTGFVIPREGGVLTLDFLSVSDGIPISVFSGQNRRLLRSNQLISPEPSNRYFQNSPALYDSANAISNRNADVASYTGLMPEPRYTYVSMYIVAVGQDDNLTRIYSKPTLINIFRLP